jgi:hypothetical protein
MLARFSSHSFLSTSYSSGGAKRQKQQQRQQQRPSRQDQGAAEDSPAALYARLAPSQLAHLVGVMARAPGGQVPLDRPPASVTCLRISGLAEELLAAGKAAGLVERVAGDGSRGPAAFVRVGKKLMSLLKKGGKRGAGATVKQEARAAAAAGPAGGEGGPSLLQQRLAGFATWWLAQQQPGGKRRSRTALQSRLRRLCGSKTQAQAVLAVLKDPLWAVVEEGAGWLARGGWNERAGCMGAPAEAVRQVCA